MRIVGGTLSGRKIEPPLSLVTRPMMDRVRESLFNVLAHRDWGPELGDLFEAEINVLDAFCGTGALAFESLSRGAAQATLFDKDQQALMIAKKNAATLGLTSRCNILMGDATQPPRATKQCALVFLAPPYRKGLIPPALAALDQAGWIAKHAVIVAETAKKEELPALEGFPLLLQRFYGDTGLHFMAR